MADKFKRINKEFALTDSSVNCYGFRLLTEGYQLAEYERNPIGYYMHKREDGVVVKWENLHAIGDVIYGTPVVNLSNPRGEATCDEIENGFLNAASVGHIVVLEYSTDPAMMLVGQTGPTITKWYNRECSVVDIPGNANALTQLYDADDNLLNLADMTSKPILTADNLKSEYMNEIKLSADAAGVLNLSAGADAVAINGAIIALAARAKTAEDNLSAFTTQTQKKEVSVMLAAALADKKITVELQAKLATDYATNPESLKVLLAAMPGYTGVVDQIGKKNLASPNEANWTWKDYELNDPSGKKLQALRDNDTTRYKLLFEDRFKRERD